MTTSATLFNPRDPTDVTTRLQSICARMWAEGYSYDEMARILDRKVDRLKNQISKWKLSKPDLFRPRTGQSTIQVLCYRTVPVVIEQRLRRTLGPGVAFATLAQLRAAEAAEIAALGAFLAEARPDRRQVEAAQ